MNPIPRPAHLPDFQRPPLDELVMGVQFERIPGFASMNVAEVWSLYKGEYPNLQELPLLPPQFEIFGGVNPLPPIHFFGTGPLGSRMWFISEDKNYLLQFQADRLLTNWRRNPDQKQDSSKPYPRFEAIAEAYRLNLNTLNLYFESTFSHPIKVNQAEISYINIIPAESFSEVGKWFSILNSDSLDIEGLNLNFNEVIRDSADRPVARLFHTIQSVILPDRGRKAFHLSLTFRGKPTGTDIDSALKLIRLGREAIVTRFKAITTEAAHQIWGMTN